MMDIKRWNFELRDGCIAVCKDHHEKGQPCEYEELSPSELFEIIEAQQGLTVKLQSQLEEAKREKAIAIDAAQDMNVDMCKAQRERDLLASCLRFVTPFNPGPELFEQLSSANEQLKRREWVRAIRYAVNKLERPDAPLAPSMILNDDLLELAKRIESGEVEL